ncbi:MAG: anaerobic ribonucleoside-triphosphate reductase activating protein [Bacteroidales bacterium]|nr:anaerobic ribonucleoside-triphosphate reductase activating protein [Bacteroidales bacterium]
MKIGGFVKQSLIDYPGKIAAIVFTQGCNFRCGYCHNPQLVLPGLFQTAPEYTVDTITNFLGQRKNWLDGVVITGGEPTIHKGLPNFMLELKQLGYCVKLDTNGTNPIMLASIIQDKLADYIAMDIKTLTEPHLYSNITGISMSIADMENIVRSIGLLKSAKIESEFRTTFIPGTHKEKIINQIREMLGNAKPYFINNFRAGENINTIQIGPKVPR